jgi:hypothetical protein
MATVEMRLHNARFGPKSRPVSVRKLNVPFLNIIYEYNMNKLLNRVSIWSETLLKLTRIAVESRLFCHK